MRTLIIAMGLAAIAAAPALAQVSRGSAGTPAATAGTTTTSTTTTGTTLPSTAVGAEPVLTGPAATTTSGTSTTVPTTGSNTAFGTNVQTDPAAVANATPPFGPGGAFSTDPGAGATGVAGTTGTPGTIGTIVPEGTVSVIGGGSAGTGVIGIPTQSQQVTIAPAASTPLFDQVAREGRAKEERRRARGEEPRIFGIAPNTERDLTWQMPDDRIIRY